MITCPYCGIELVLEKYGDYANHANCNLCNIILGPSSGYGMYAQNGKRVSKKRLNLITVEDCKVSLPELMQYHTADLLQLLRLAREERATQYNLLRTINNAIKQGFDEYAEPAEEQGREYEEWTRIC